jgi:hypothetical protein
MNVIIKYVALKIHIEIIVKPVERGNKDVSHTKNKKIK